jgi:hypothetical protein
MLACQDRRADILEYCLGQGGFPIESIFLEEAESVDAAKEPATYNVIANFHTIRQSWEVDRLTREQRERRQQEESQQGKHWRPDENGTWAGRTHGADPGTAAVFDVRGKLPVPW